MMNPIEQVTKAIETMQETVKAEFLRWAFGVALAHAIGYGMVTFKIDDHRVKDVEIMIRNRFQDSNKLRGS